jgi:trimeric autotransporter adhesin
MNITLNWTIGVGSTSQDVQYKLNTSGTWITHSTVSGSTNVASITGLSDNQIYDFRVVSSCGGGTPGVSSVTQQINMVCPTVSTSPTDVTIPYSFAELGGSVTSYIVKLFDNAGSTELSSQTPSGTTTRSGTFTGLTQNTSYKIRVIPTAGSFTKTTCAFISATTLVTPSCNPPTSVTATLA